MSDKTESPFTDSNLGIHPKLKLTPPDADLWDNFRNGCESSYIKIFEGNVKLLFKYGYRIVPEEELVKDCIQELFIDLWRRHASLGPTSCIKFYLFKSLRRKLNRSLTSSPGFLFLDDLKEECSASVQSHEFIIVDEQETLEKKRAILSILGKLSARQREAIFLKYYEGLNYEEIAQIMSLSRQAAYNLINKSLEVLRQYFIFLITAFLYFLK